MANVELCIFYKENALQSRVSGWSDSAQLRPAQMKVMNLFLHCAASLLVWRVGRAARAGATTATLSAIMFACHPVHVEPVLR